MGDLAGMTSVDKLISVSDNLVEFLKDRRDVNNLTECFRNYESFNSSCLNHSSEVEGEIQDYERKIYACKQKIDAAKSEVTLDEELDHLQDQLEEKIQRERLLDEELRKVIDEVNDLEHQRASVEERKQILKKCEKDDLREEKKLSMYASVTNAIPGVVDQLKISGYIIDSDGKLQENEFDPMKVSAFDSCNSIWKMIIHENP